jgi:hypothetical protein
MLVTVGAGFVIEKLTPLDNPPPGVGLLTVTVGDPAVLISAALIEAVS